jgi:hypothetical protein
VGEIHPSLRQPYAIAWDEKYAAVAGGGGGDRVPRVGLYVTRLLDSESSYTVGVPIPSDTDGQQ